VITQETTPVTPERGPRTVTVVIFLSAFAMIFSWLAVYAVPNALIVADLLPPLARDHDPRPRWLMISFGAIFGGLVLVPALMGLISRLQMRRMDHIAEAEE